MTYKSFVYLTIIILVVAVLLPACKLVRTPADVIVDYLEALAASDKAAAVSNSCAAWEESALAEGTSFINVDVALKDLECQILSQTDQEATVTCTGGFLFSYDAGEDQTLDLYGQVFSLVMEAGEWRMCGYKFIFE